MYSCINPKHSVMNALVSASFGFVLRSPSGGETKPAGEPAPLKTITLNIKIGGTKLLVITELKY